MLIKNCFECPFLRNSDFMGTICGAPNAPLICALTTHVPDDCPQLTKPVTYKWERTYKGPHGRQTTPYNGN